MSHRFASLRVVLKGSLVTQMTLCVTFAAFLSVPQNRHFCTMLKSLKFRCVYHYFWRRVSRGTTPNVVWRTLIGGAVGPPGAVLGRLGWCRHPVSRSGPSTGSQGALFSEMAIFRLFYEHCRSRGPLGGARGCPEKTDSGFLVCRVERQTVASREMLLW